MYMISPTFFRLINDLKFTSFDIQVAGRLNANNPVLAFVQCQINEKRGMTAEKGSISSYIVIQIY